VDLDLRKLRYFVAVAEELNFRRAAERLHLAQPVLSRQIRALEKELHARLFTRDNTGTQLTEAGYQLLNDATVLLANAEAAQRRVARAAAGTVTFTVGFMPGLTVTDPVRALGAAHPDINVEVLRTDWTNQVAVLHDGRADIGYVRMPVDRTGLKSSLLFTEPRVAVLPASHRLAGKEKVSIHDLAESISCSTRRPCPNGGLWQRNCATGHVRPLLRRAAWRRSWNGLPRDAALACCLNPRPGTTSAQMWRGCRSPISHPTRCDWHGSPRSATR